MRALTLAALAFLLFSSTACAGAGQPSKSRSLLYGQNVVWPVDVPLTGQRPALCSAGGQPGRCVSDSALAFFDKYKIAVWSYGHFHNIDYGLVNSGGNFSFGVFLNGAEPLLAMPVPAFSNLRTDALLPNATTSDLFFDLRQALEELQGGRADLGSDELLLGYDPGQFYESERLLPSQSEELVFQFPLRTCHACTTNVAARVAYTFGPDGSYLGMKVLGVCRTAVGQKVPLKTPIVDCPSTLSLVGNVIFGLSK